MGFLNDIMLWATVKSQLMIEFSLFALTIYLLLCVSWLIESWLTKEKKGITNKSFHKWFWIALGVVLVASFGIVIISMIWMPVVVIWILVKVFKKTITV